MYTSLLASSLEDMKKEIRAEFDEEICKKIDSKLSCSQSSSTPRMIESTRVKRPDHIFGECAKLPDLQETEKRSLKSGTTFLHEVMKPTQRPKTFDGKTSWDAYKTQFEIVAQINRWDDNEKAAFLTASLQGPAVNVLNCLSESSRRSYNALLQALDSRYGTL